MVKSRNFRAGFGLGMIAGALLLQLMLAGESQQAKLTGFAGGENPEDSGQAKTYTEQEVAALIEKARREGASEAASSAASQEPQAPAKAEQSGAAKLKTVIRIPPSSSLTQTAAILQDNGLIGDEAAFVAYIRKQKLSGSIRAGYFLFEGKPAMEDIRNTITGEPLPEAKGKEWMAANGKSK
ncbi:hypothetical protein [Paenibacillus beijingensis]|uniref:Endolytic transglycosylase MltG n=1 Tax=Paenibacillus beijingensis TaxID=1126833 RepID=A0A0D5NMP3_9BACL|nr:hypothetical protein [Paenibacillus beijingensis]AJY76594.1 hypothetical protein VN24_20995 [Paenibacillus beijingensis]